MPNYRNTDYKADLEQGMTEIGCMAHARHKFFDLHDANSSRSQVRFIVVVEAGTSARNKAMAANARTSSTAAKTASA
ncbi:hypothetical protein C1Y26_16755 [Pseudomonas sp. MPR-R2A7]|nr:hypothetical protein C1X90_17960 [Pseudomonas sp. GP01-A9]PMU28539.1 hypothetical protein C1X88_17610 [Pseudomonas sp. GP01-A13]PMU38791.1 hypothetical protein C1X89_15165 [Pseudomonas sp. GP01-A8]PMU52409.1 hypothetical protein C1X85_18720 [Pseudomonas sp. GP01-A6]PMU54406.1 hypothetical protein C1X87_06225 [Pseudomonas sp. GP01-A14]PMU61448.1 hypothetical protein C1X86_17995 [Pseudomonas sp. GP01-A3]PMU72922.1 hypothetical protein C1X84_18650 [Pseudomonas sp. GP01-A1]PMU73304.1 hypothet